MYSNIYLRLLILGIASTVLALPTPVENGPILSVENRAAPDLQAEIPDSVVRLITEPPDSESFSPVENDPV